MQKTIAKFNYYRDAGHGWVAVKKNILEKIGVANKITEYSYQREKMAYLEEDCDMSTFINAFREFFGKDPSIEVVDHGDRSWVRSQDTYKA
jgi:hypothetical protein